MYDEITIIWNTDELKRSKPTPSEEARWGLAIIEDSLWETIPKVYRRLNQIFVKNMGRGLPKNFNPIEFGSWMGGDRDGNPYVTSAVTNGLPSLSPPIHDPNSIGLKFLGKPLPIFFSNI